MNWNNIIELEPALLQLKTSFSKVDVNSAIIWNIYESYKATMKTMVGFDARKKELKSVECYDISWKEIFGDKL